MAELRRRRSVSQTLLVDLVTRQFAEHAAELGHPLEITDVGGGTGVLAIELGRRGHVVTVVDPSPDALAALERRIADAGLLERVRGRQGDAATLAELGGAGSADVVVCHRVLEVVDSPSAALEAMTAVLRSGGRLSLLVPQRHAVVLAQALLGHLEQAREAYAREALDYERTLRLVADAGLVVREAHGVGAVADHVPAAVVDGDARAFHELLELERAISTDPAFRAVAPQLHVLAERE